MSRLDIRRFRAALRSLEREMLRALKDQTTCCGVTLAQCHLLMELDGHGQRTVSGLAEAMGLDKSTLSRTLDGMAAASLVDRVEDHADRRALNVSLTVKGRDTAERINGKCDADYRDLFALMPVARRRAVLEAVELLADAMKTARERGPAR